MIDEAFESIRQDLVDGVVSKCVKCSSMAHERDDFLCPDHSLKGDGMLDLSYLNLDEVPFPPATTTKNRILFDRLISLMVVVCAKTEQVLWLAPLSRDESSLILKEYYDGHLDTDSVANSINYLLLEARTDGVEPFDAFDLEERGYVWVRTTPAAPRAAGAVIHHADGYWMLPNKEQYAYAFKRNQEVVEYLRQQDEKNASS